MPLRKYKTNKDLLLAEGMLIVSSSNDSRFQHKVEMVNLVLSGLVPSELCRYVAESKNTITLWVKIADEQGFDALKTKKQNGRPPKLTLKHLDSIKEILKEDNPKKYNYNVWDGPALSDYIKKRYRIKLSIRQCQRIFKKLGFSLIRPHTLPSKNKSDLAEKREAFKKR